MIKVPCYYIICLDDNLISYQLCIFEVNINQCYELIKKIRFKFLSPICLMLNLTKVL